MKRLLLLLQFSILMDASLGQVNYLMSLANGEEISSNEIQFDVFIKSDESVFKLTSYQCSFSYDAGNLSSPSFSYINGSSQLTNFPQNGIGIWNNEGLSLLTFASSAGNDSIPGSMIKVGRFRLTNALPFSADVFRISWNFSGAVNTIITGSGYENITSPTRHTDMIFYPDTTEPKLIKAECFDLTKVRLYFSEELNDTSAVNLNHYSIDKGIIVESASLCPGDTAVILSTSRHQLNTNYKVTASRVIDRAGNLITSSSNSAQYSLHEIHKLALKFFLEGPYRNGKMETNLRLLNLLPRLQPYNRAPWNYNGSEYADSIPGNAVDWVLVELRSDTSDSSTKYRHAAFLNENGKIFEPGGNEYLTIATLLSGDYYIVVKHRNHLPVMSAVPVKLHADSISYYDFSISSGQTYGTSSEISLGENIFGIYSGDANGNGIINNNDYTEIWKKENGNIGYKAGDFDLNGGVNISDKNLYWKINNGKATQVP